MFEFIGCYYEFFNCMYVEDKDIFKWCLGFDCLNVIECGVKRKDFNKIVLIVECKCGYCFCFGCLNFDY